MDEKKNDDISEVVDLLGKSLHIHSSHIEKNRSIGCSQTVSRNDHSTPKDENYTWRNADRATKNFSQDRNVSESKLGWRDRSVPLNVRPFPCSIPRRHTTSNKTEQTNWRNRKLNGNDVVNFSRTGSSRSYEGDKNGSNPSEADKATRRNDWSQFYSSERPKKEIFVGYRYLKSLSEKEPHEMISEIFGKEASIDVILNRKEIEPDWIMLIMETIRKLCDCDFKSNRVQALQYFCESPLLNHISSYLGELGMERKESTIKNLNTFVSDLAVFYSAVLNTVPTVAVDKNFDRLLSKTKIGVDQIQIYLDLEIDEAIVEKLVNLEKILENEKNIYERKMDRPSRNNLDRISELQPPDHFRYLSCYPTEEDLNRSDFGFVRPNKIKGAYENVDHYLDVQFRLIREDFIDPLRRGIREYKNSIALHGKLKYKNENVHFYPDTRVEYVKVTGRNQAAYVVNFNANGKLKLNHIKWESNKRFMFGSLLVFTSDNFESFFLATVSSRELSHLRRGYVLVTFIGYEPLDSKMLKNKTLVMAECEVFFEPYFLVMEALKQYNRCNFPMEQFIVDGNTVVELPWYIRNLKYLHIYQHKVNMLEDTDWPDHSEIGFDEHQFNAFKTAFTSNFTVIQGPPGTGKTYLGLKIVQVLLNNIIEEDSIFYNNKIPILLVCYTNHALDQFLEGILEFTDDIVRVGGQSRSEILIPYNLRGSLKDDIRKEVRRSMPVMRKCRDGLRSIVNQLHERISVKNSFEKPLGILSYFYISKVFSAEVKQLIPDRDTLLFWLLDINYYFSIAYNNSKKKIFENVDADTSEPVKIDEEIHYEEENETMEESILFNDDDIFEFQVETDHNIYCVTMHYLKLLYDKMQKYLEKLKTKSFSDDSEYSEYRNREYQLKENLRIIKLQSKILYHFLHNVESESSTEFELHSQNLWEMPLDLRWRIYWTWVTKLKPIIVIEMKNLEMRYRFSSDQYVELKQIEDFHVVRKSHVIGMTTTGAARLQLLLKTLRPKIVIVEEAAEVLEAHIVVSLTSSCEHVILIGDHKQLKPSTAVYELSKKYNIDVSLFERMINNNLYCPQLQVQHRMRPEISSLIAPSIYPDLKNHESVFEFPSVRGITKNVFFVEHTVHEENVDDSVSRKNIFEAEFMIQLCRYILLQGYDAEKITILTTYTGQMFLIREMKREYAIMKDVRVVVIDKYQGEENDIILLSLVRSNRERKIGFLSVENRVCVALSRAKIGLYIVGNMEILSDSSLWKNIKEELIKQDAIGPKLTLYCDKHDFYTKVSCASDFNNVKDGGCNSFCHEIMDCGHRCQRVCHKTDTKHLEKNCLEKCLRQCIEGHPCKELCYKNCSQCFEPVERILPCEHTVTLPCFKDYENYPCQVKVSVILELCSHEVVKKCSQPIEEVKCTFPCEDRLECGHQCMNTCHKTDDPDHLQYECFKPCDKINSECSKEHKCERRCFEDCGQCRVPVDVTLKCGHEINLECSINPDEVDCQKPCGKKCLECEAVCPKLCYEDCKPCKNKVTKSLLGCGHEKKLQCWVIPERKLCTEKSQQIAVCGHEYESVCGKEEGTYRCEKIVQSTCVKALCGHGFVNVPCWRKTEMVDAEESLQYCTEPCNEILKCGDPCTGTCNSCWQGRLHQSCDQKCDNILVCGHSCSSMCRNLCPPCTQKCEYACKHSKCSKNCGVPCDLCEKKCEWKCDHFECTKKCGDICDRPLCYEPCSKKLPCEHDCVGFCGEPCPPKCRICDETEVKKIFFGNEDKDDARFVLLEDCGHFVESKAMDKYIDFFSERGEVLVKSCPLCKTPITKTLRYMNEVKRAYRDIQNVQQKIYGNENEIKKIRLNTIRKLQNMNLKNALLFKKELTLIPETVAKYKKKLQTRSKRRQWNASKPELTAMNYFANMFSSIISRLDDVKKCADSEKSLIFKKLEFILKLLNFEILQINLQQVDETQKELNRYHRIVDYGLFLNQTEYLNNRNSPNVICINADITSILYGLNTFDNEQDIRISELFEKLRGEVKSSQSVSQKEMRIIHDKMAKDLFGLVNRQDRWFICTEGHYCCITECGGTMQENNCLECGEKIGGCLETARLPSSGMDSTARPVWSNHIDMESLILSLNETSYSSRIFMNNNFNEDSD